MECAKRRCSKAHPTCNLLPLRTGAKIVALMDMVFGLIGIIWFLVVLEKYGIISLDPFEKIDVSQDSSFSEGTGSLKNANGTHSQIETKLSKNHKIISLSLTIFYTFVNLLMFTILLVGAHQKSIAKCLIWFYIRCAIFVFKLIIYTMYIISGRPLFSQIPFMLSMVAHLYGLWLVNCYVNELQKERRQVKIDQIMKNAVAQQEDDIPNGIERWIQRRKEIEGEENPAFTPEKS